MKLFNRITAFTIVMVLNVFAQVNKFEIEKFEVVILALLGLTIANLVYNIAKFKKDCITIWISVILILGILSIYVIPPLGELYIGEVVTAFYISLFLIAIIPPIFNKTPFTVEISKRDYPESVTKTDQFLQINYIMAYVWAIIFALSFVLSILHYSSNEILNTVLSSVVPILLQATVGVYLTIKLPKYLMGRVKAKVYKFESVKDLFSAMPYGLNKENAKDVDTIIQFNLSGDEKIEAYFTIKDVICTYTEGKHPNPKTRIICDSKLWLDISNGDTSGDEAFIKNDYEVIGDASILLSFAELFAPPKSKKKAKSKKVIKKSFEYKKYAPKKIKNIVVFDGGPRTRSFSKTTFMTENFTKGAIAAGAKVDYIKLSKMDIKDCSGCYHCWTKTPGECIYKDDMTELRKKYREADLVVFASPLYIFSVTGTMKRFMDRLLPTMKPYMLSDEEGNTLHPDRFPELGEQGFVVFASAGFPEVDHNFDGLSALYRNFDSHSENNHLMGEFYLTAAEIIVQPVYKQRRENIKEACFNAGKQVVEEGFISQEFMDVPSVVGTDKETFNTQADMFWSTMDGKKSYLKSCPKFEKE